MSHAHKELSKKAANLLLVLASILWGTCIIAMQISLNAGMPPTLINFGRGIVYTVLSFILFYRAVFRMRAKEIKNGLILGIINFLAFYFQSVGLQYTSPSNNSFITGMNVLSVPFLLWIFVGKRPGLKAALCVLFSIAGMAVLTGITTTEGLCINRGDVFTLIAALLFAMQITYLGTIAKDIDVRVLVFLMSIVQCVGGGVLFFIVDYKTIPQIDWAVGIPALVYLGIIGSFLASWMQTWAQKYTNPTTSSIIISSESVFASGFSILFGCEMLNANLLFGGAIILTSTIIAQLSFRKKTE